MRFSRTQRLLLFGLVNLLVFSFCSSGYITPNSLAETAEAEQAPPTAFFTSPTPTRYLSPTPSLTPEVSPTPSVEPSATPEQSPRPAPPVLYSVQAGDTREAVALRFGVAPEEITSNQDIRGGLLTPGQLLVVPYRLGVTTPGEQIMPDSEVVFAPSSVDFNIRDFVTREGGYLASYQQYLPNDWHSGAEVVLRVAQHNSINPRLLLSILQYQSDWVSGQPRDERTENYPIGYIDVGSQALNRQLIWAVKQLSTGYYGWRNGSLTTLTFTDGITIRINPTLNAGSVAVQYLFSQLYDYEEWQFVIDPDVGFPFLHAFMFPDPVLRAAQYEPLYPASLEQPALDLPFFSTQIWYYSSGPHGAWEREGAQAALDFAPSSTETGCAPSNQWLTAMAAGTIVRTGVGTLVLDLDGDGFEQTGWVLVYLHVDYDGNFQVGDTVSQGQQLGHPSCLGGTSTGTHVHIARKYNGEWIGAAGPIPFVLSGWAADWDGVSYQGRLLRDGDVVTACTCGNSASRIARGAGDP
mgnify:CR=1 FL=1